MSKRIPCPNTECDGGVVYVNNAYSADPLKPEAELCELCFGHSFILSSGDAALLN